MELRTYTSLWGVEKRLYKFYDINLPYPVSVKQLALLAGFSIPWIFLMVTLGVPFGPPFGHIFWIAPPLLFAWQANKKVTEGKSLYDYAVSQISFFLGNRCYTGLTDAPTHEEVFNIHGETWSSFSADKNT